MHHIEVPAFEQGKRFFDVETMEFVAGVGFEGQGADFMEVVHIIIVTDKRFVHFIKKRLIAPRAIDQPPSHVDSL